MPQTLLCFWPAPEMTLTIARVTWNADYLAELQAAGMAELQAAGLAET